jgi:RimJ/RimL family protein N-acetyltransferase
MTNVFLYSPRLLFVAATSTLLQIELASTEKLAQLLNVATPADWPPGEYDQSAMQFFLDGLRAGGPGAVGWYSWYIIAYPTATTPATLVAAAGYVGPPDETGTIEIGYSVSEEWRRQGIATEIVAQLVTNAWQHENVKRITAHTQPDGVASIGVLTKNGFNQIDSDVPEILCFELLPAEES